MTKPGILDASVAMPSFKDVFTTELATNGVGAVVMAAAAADPSSKLDELGVAAGEAAASGDKALAEAGTTTF